MDNKDTKLLDPKNTKCFADGGANNCIVIGKKNKNGCTKATCNFYKTRMQFIDGIFKAKALNLSRGIPEYPPAEHGGDVLDFYSKIWKRIDRGETIEEKD
jgi:hypothetical protein